MRTGILASCCLQTKICLKKNTGNIGGANFRKEGVPILKKWHIAATAINLKITRTNHFKPLFPGFPLSQVIETPIKLFKAKMRTC